LGIVSCHVCGQKLRVPDGKRGTVTCPCGAEWFHPETIELSDVEFRCSRSGARFNVISSRRSPQHKFVIQEIKKAARASAAAEQCSQKVSPEPVDPVPRLAARKIGTWLASIVGRIPETPSSATSPPVSRVGTSGVAVETATRDSNEYNWSGFSCPYCDAGSFVACAGGHLACDGSAQSRDGRRFHQCYCGAAGFIAGTTKATTAKRLSLEAQPNSLPPPAAESRRPSGKPANSAPRQLTKGEPPA